MKAPFQAIFGLVLSALVFVSASGTAGAHCQVPCGIYDHHARIQEIHEHVATIEKATKNIINLAGNGDAQSLNQATRWIATKDWHAQQIQDIVSHYFLTQVVKPATSSDKEGYKAYLNTLAAHHAVLVAAMKTKQKVDQNFVNALKSAVEKLDAHYHK